MTSLRMPGEFEPHRGTLMIWPVRPGSWPFDAKPAQKAFCTIMQHLVRDEEVFLLADSHHYAQALSAAPRGVQVLEVESDDAWARDVGPTFVRDGTGRLHGIDWAFNAWGGHIDGLYASWDLDDAVASAFCRKLGYPVIDAHPFILEGGSIHVDGQGTLITTEACLLSAGRNASLTRQQIEDTLSALLGVTRIIWLPRGIYMDETNEHVDNICAFVRPGEVVLAWTDDPDDPQYALSHACMEVLQREKDALGRSIIVHRLPIPARPVTIAPEDLPGFVFEPGEAQRLPGERLAASYVNFYIGNRVVLVPQFGDENDSVALRILGELFPDRSICPIPARDILLGGGNIHCITQQIPKGGS